MILILRICLATASFSCVYCLTCLRCTDIESPRHCKHVMECPSGEVCHMHMTTNKYGEVLYDLGCTETSTCYNRSHGNQLCDDCCSTDLCNAAGCGHTGFPSGRGPICYSCSAQTTEGSCHTIDFCATNEMCMINEEREFGDRVYTSRCAVNAHCENQKTETAAIIGRSVSQHSRSVTETMCHQCCHRDLCNAHCVPITKADYCASTPCVNGRCDNSMPGNTCVCDQLYTGQNCSEVNYPCVHGRCVNGMTGYTCVCDPLYNGQICSVPRFHRSGSFLPINRGQEVVLCMSFLENSWNSSLKLALQDDKWQIFYMCLTHRSSEGLDPLV
ncbi:protein crumbs homolog 1-like isoform X1 [Dreissena polymorpha]|uniref:protein crumbs homolog 1-like isoform X1 n=1 Tax=Dreissena polymorpha TaxID=45954 RepID=UPI002264A303|nr:protein crumbs homolog 1-like isoform X1 [Dreissena polymorpha]